MGKQAKIKQQRSQLRQLFDKHTPQEVHRSIAYPPDAVCRCGSKKIAMRARSFMPCDDLIAKHPGLAMEIASKYEGKIPLVDFVGPGGRPAPHAKIGEAFACDLCKVALQRSAASGPSYVTVEFDEGPKNNVQFGAVLG